MVRGRLRMPGAVERGRRGRRVRARRTLTRRPHHAPGGGPGGAAGKKGAKIRPCGHRQKVLDTRHKARDVYLSSVDLDVVFAARGPRGDAGDAHDVAYHLGDDGDSLGPFLSPKLLFFIH